ncbi:hypothetical protein H3C61_03945 [Candidatus Gracilibacteria bacterium]|nr:hypothetical protein [Candidatus Gracilibacteria bacterium]
MDKKIINNAISAYFGLGFLLLLPSKKENINNIFVKKHSKTAVFIHFLMFLNYLIFINYKLLGGYSLFGFYLNHVIATTIFLGLFGAILYGVYKASLGDDLLISDLAQKTKAKNLVELKNSNLNQEGIFTIILSLIPIIGFTLRGRFYNYKSNILENNIKFNLIFTLIISIVFLFSFENIGFLFLLIYFIFIGFYSVMIITKKEVINFKLEKIKTFKELYILFLTTIKYIKNYFTNNFKIFQIILDETLNKFNENKLKDKEMLSSLEDGKIKKIFYYIPIINLISFIDINSKNKFHVENGFIITVLFILILIFKLNIYLLFLLFLISFSIGYFEKKDYKIYFLYDIYAIFKFIFLKVFGFGKKGVSLKNKKNEITFEIEK